ncbi:hypothetical protein CKAN_01663900 [Cinnamomum micranthum f. kanehirae]|uniref:Uncharacterized protein n=1 Tax=Cinnamomum micranthum f. kanehirae TaxID=337451 RepID=A0A443PA75_9MAGN|nr:hypothetical protein CKAN_01663900 [Cinnamomum micranthum f. kanehirae]
MSLSRSSLPLSRLSLSPESDSLLSPSLDCLQLLISTFRDLLPPSPISAITRPALPSPARSIKGSRSFNKTEGSKCVEDGHTEALNLLQNNVCNVCYCLPCGSV